MMQKDRGDGVASIKQRRHDLSSDGIKDLTTASGHRGDGVASIKRRRRDLSSDGVKDLTMASGRNRLKSDLEDLTW
ncbi:hypothetical protein Tco_0970519 [Tanacetum coccineum]